MSVLVDTAVWSLALRRPAASAPAAELARLVRDGEAVIIGAIRQEILSGVRTQAQFETLRARLQAFPDVALETEDYEDAASSFNACRSRGIQGSNTDFLICAAASRRKLAIFTTDRDFDRFARILPIRLHAARSGS